MALTETFTNIEDILSFLVYLLFNFKLLIVCNIILDRCKLEDFLICSVLKYYFKPLVFCMLWSNIYIKNRRTVLLFRISC